MLDVLDAVHVAVQVNVTVFHLTFAHQLRMTHLDASGFVNRTVLHAYIVNYRPAVQCQQIGRLAGFHTDHGPYRTGITDGFSVFIQDGKISVRKQTVHIFHPRLYGETFVCARHILQFYCQSGKYPRVMILIQRGNTKSSVGCMKPGAVQQMVAQYAHSQPFHKIHMKRFGYKPVSSNFTVLCHISILLILIPFFAVCQVLIHPFKATCRNGNTPGAYKLQHTVQLFQLLIQRRDVIAHSHHFHD